MREIPKKNYFILLVLLIITVLLTLFLSKVYINKSQLVSNFYKYSNVITKEEFDQFMTENSDVIIYISDKHDLTHSNFEDKFKTKIDELNLKHNLIYLDKNEIDKNFLKKIKEKYNINIDLKNTPIIVVIVDNKVVKNILVTENLNIDTMIEYGEFE